MPTNGGGGKCPQKDLKKSGIKSTGARFYRVSEKNFMLYMLYIGTRRLPDGRRRVTKKKKENPQGGQELKLLWISDKWNYKFFLKGVLYEFS